VSVMKSAQDIEAQAHSILQGMHPAWYLQVTGRERYSSEDVPCAMTLRFEVPGRLLCGRSYTCLSIFGNFVMLLRSNVFVPSYDKVELALAKESRRCKTIARQPLLSLLCLSCVGCVHCVGKEAACLRKRFLAGRFAPVCVVFC
jgi:hypothetical protein